MADRGGPFEFAAAAVGIVLVALAVLGAGGVALAWHLAGLRPSTKGLDVTIAQAQGLYAALGFVASLLLVGITAWYASLNRRMVEEMALARADRQRERLEAERELDERRERIVELAVEEGIFDGELLAQPQQGYAWLVAETTAIDALIDELGPTRHVLALDVANVHRALIRYNTMAEYSNHRVTAGSGLMNSDLRAAAEAARNELTRIVPELEQLRAARLQPQPSGAKWPWKRDGR